MVPTATHRRRLNTPNLRAIAPLILFTIATVVAFSEAAHSEPNDSKRSIDLFDAYWRADRGSSKRAHALEELREHIGEPGRDGIDPITEVRRAYTDEKLGEGAIQVFRDYLAAPIGSELEAELQEQLQKRVRESDLEEPVAMALFAAADDEIPDGISALSLDGLVPPNTVGGIDALAPTPIIFELIQPAFPVTAGSNWSLIGKIRNQSERVVWIVDKYTTISLAPSLYGSRSNVGSIGAFFPTIDTFTARAHDIIRLDPGSTYSVVWSIDPARLGSGEKQRREANPDSFFSQLSTNIANLARQILNAWSDFLFFVPGSYPIVATIHVWSVEPDRPDGRVMNVGESNIFSDHSSLEVSSSPWVLIFGAWIGGTLAFGLQTLSGFNSGSGDPGDRSFKALMLGFLTAILLTSVVTILLSRMSTSNFIVSIEVQDLWGSIATGFVVQWIGFAYLKKLFSEDKNDPQEISATTGTDTR